jgi:hypothetical protein
MSFIDNYYLDLLEAERTIDRLKKERNELYDTIHYWHNRYQSLFRETQENNDE